MKGDWRDDGNQPASAALTVRDVFIGFALMGLLAEPQWAVPGVQPLSNEYSDLPNDSDRSHMARAAVVLADAILKERNRG